MHRRQFLTSLLALPFLGFPLGQMDGISIGGWYFKVGSELDCGIFLTLRATHKTEVSGGLYTFFYDYIVDDEWLADFKESTAIFGCHSVWLPVVVK